MEAITVDRALGPRVNDLLELLMERFEQRRQALEPWRISRRAQLAAGDVGHLDETLQSFQLSTPKGGI